MKFKNTTFTVSGFVTLIFAATKEMPKGLLQIINKDLVQYALEKAIPKNLDNEQNLGALGKNGTTVMQFTEGHKQLQIRLKKKSKGSVLLALVSKNEFANVNGLFYERDNFPLYWDYFVLAGISWLSKSKSSF